MREANKFNSWYSDSGIDSVIEIMISSGATVSFYNYLEDYARPYDEILNFEPRFGFFIPPLLNALQR